MAGGLRPFCSNPKCQHHGKQVPDHYDAIYGLSTLLGYAYFKHAQNSPPVEENKTVVIKRHSVVRVLEGVAIKDYLCDVCFEVLNQWQL